MYHIPSDKRAKESAWHIYQSLRHILFTKKLCDVTISDINKESGISRTTFYRLFDNITDVLEMQLEVFFTQYKKELPYKKDRLLYFFEFFDMHSDLIYILANQNESVIKTVMERTFIKKKEADLDAKEEYELSLKLGMLTSVLCKWVLRLKKESPEQMAVLIRDLLQKKDSLLTEI